MTDINSISVLKPKLLESSDFLWTVRDEKMFHSRLGTLSSPIFNAGNDDQNQFQIKLQFRERNIDSYHGSYFKVYLSYSRKDGDYTAELEVRYNISLMGKSEKNFMVGQHTFPKYSSVKQIFEISLVDFPPLLNCGSFLIFDCQVSIAVENRKNSLNLDSNKVSIPKLKLDSVFLDEKFSDVMLRTAGGKAIPAHRIVLDAASPVFKAMFSHDTLENKTRSVDMVDISYEAAIEMLRYIYTGSAVTQEFLVIVQLLMAADKYQLERLEELKNECAQMLSCNISSENAVDILKVANKYSMKSLKIKVVEYIKQHINESSDPDNVCNLILSMEQLFSK